MLIQHPATYKNLTANATTTLKSGAGRLYAITLNTKGASANTLTVYDNTAASGTKIGTFDTVNGVIGLMFEAPFGVNFSTGLTAVLATGTAADVTFVFE